MKISSCCVLAAAAMLGCLYGCGFGRPFQPAGWDCRVYRIDDLELCSRRTITESSALSEAETLRHLLQDPFLRLTP